MPFFDEFIPQKPSSVSFRPRPLPYDIVHAGSYRLVARSCHHLGLCVGMDKCLLCRPETAAHQDPLGAQHESCSKTAPIRDTAGSNYNDIGGMFAQSVHHRRHERQRRPGCLAVAARFRALSNDNIGPNIGCSSGLVDGTDLADERHTGLLDAGRERRRIGKGQHNCPRMTLDCEVEQVRLLCDRPSDEPHPTSLRVIFADSVSNQERSPYPPPSRPRPPAAATAAAKSAPAAGVIGARMIGCSMSKNFINRVLIITIPLWFAAIQLPLFRYNVADAA